MDIAVSKNRPILFLINGLGLGGAEKVFVEQTNALYEAGLPVYLGSLYGSVFDKGFFADIKIPADHTVIFGFKKLFDMRGFLNLRRFILDKRISVVYSTLEEANIVARLLKLIKPSIRIIIRESSGNAGRKLWKFKILDICLNFFADKIVAVSHGVKDSLKRYQKIHANKLVVVENGVNMPEGEFDNFFKQKTKDKINILTVGSLVGRNNQLFLTKVFRDVLRESPRAITLTIVGGGPLKEDLEDFILKNDLAHHVFLTGPVSHSDLKSFYISSHIFVLPSLWEGCPNALLEAMSYGLPVVSARVGGAVDIIEDGVSGFLVGIDKVDLMRHKIIQLASNEKLRYDMGLAARQRVDKNYSLDKSLNNLIKVLL